MRKTVEEIVDIIKKLKRFSTDYEVADLLGIGRSALSNAKKMDSLSFIDELVMFCDREELSLDFIRLDRPGGKKRLRKVSAPDRIPDGESERYVRTPVLTYRGRAPGVSSREEVDTVVIPREVYGESTIVMHVSGDSMEKLLMSGSSARGYRKEGDNFRVSLRVPHTV